METMTKEQEAEIRAAIELEDEVRQRVPEPKPMHQNARHRRILLAEVERLRQTQGMK
jgi:hypothetical protein